MDDKFEETYERTIQNKTLLDQYLTNLYQNLLLINDN